MDREVFGILDEKIKEKKLQIELLDIVDDVLGLEEEEVIERNKNTAELVRCLYWRESMLGQKAKANWLRSGDTNSSFFHKWINRRTKKNEIVGIHYKNRWLESADSVKQASLDHFKEQFSN